jgi:tetratricopeptide (TPR) repeat protein
LQDHRGVGLRVTGYSIKIIELYILVISIKLLQKGLKYILIVTLVTLFVRTGFAQNKTIDSLTTLLLKKSELHDTTRLDILFQLVESINDDNVWPKYNEQAHTLAKELSENKDPEINRKGKKGLADALNNSAYIYNQQGEIEKALDYFRESLAMREVLQDKQGIANSLNNIGSIYEQQGQIEKALDYYHRSLAIREKIKDKTGIANSLNNIGHIYNNQGQLEKALEYFRKSLAIRELIKDKQGVSQSFNNLASIYMNLDQEEKAIEYYHRSLTLQEEIRDKKGIASSLNNIGFIYKNQGQVEKALEYYERSLAVWKEIQDKAGIIYALNNIGYMYIIKKQYTDAEHYVQLSLSMAKESGYPENIRNAEELLSRIYALQGKGMPAFEHYRQFITYRDSINNLETQKASIRQQEKYAYEKEKAVTDAAHNADMEKQTVIAAAEKKKQNIIILAVAGGLLLVLVFALFIFNRFKVTQRQKKIIEEQKKTVEEKQQEILASIHYAKKIQTALLTSENYVNKKLTELNKPDL